MINYNLSTTSGEGNSAPQALNSLQTGIGAQDIHLIGDKYMIDIYGDMVSYNPQDTVLLSIIAGLGSKPMNSPYVTWNDDYNGNMWADLKFDILRARQTVGGVLNAGELKWTKSNLATQAYQATLANFKTKLYFIESDDDIVGKKSVFVRNLGNLLKNLGYRSVDDGGTAVTDGSETGYISENGTTPLYVAFEDIYFNTNGVDMQKHEVIAKINSLRWGDSYLDTVRSGTYDDYAFELELDFSDSNADDIASNSVILLEEINTGAGAAFNGDDGFTRLSRMGLIGDSQTPPDAIAEGENFESGGNFIYSVENVQNKSQIFTSPRYGVTGTRQASKARFFDEFQLSRARNLSLYKKNLNAALLRGVQSEGFSNTTGKPKRTMSGILDYSTFPIRYMKVKFPSSFANGFELANWIDHIVYSLQAFRQTGGAKAFTCLVSQNILNKLSRANAAIGSSNGNVFGGIFTVSPPSSLTLGLQVYEYKSVYGVIRFIHEPSFDLMPTLKASTTTLGGVPYHLFPNGLNPRNILMILDKGYIKQRTLRPDKIYGNIQNVGQDAFEEAMRGEHSLELRFPRNHCIVDVS